MCTGMTHLLCSAAVVTTSLTAAGSPLAVKPSDLSQTALCGSLVVVGVIGGLFPDLDAPESILLHAPDSVARKARRAVFELLSLRRKSLARLLIRFIVALPATLAGGVVAGLSLAIRSVSPHRGLTHELRGMVLFTGLLVLLISGLALLWRLPVPVVLHITLLSGAVWTLGYLTHLLLDAATISGIPLFSERRIFHLLPRGWRMRTGTWPDTLLLRGVASAWLIWLIARALLL